LQARAWQPGPILVPQPGAGQPGGIGATTAPSMEHLPGTGDGMRPDQDVGPQVGDWPCSSITGTGADGSGGLTWGPGP